MKKTKKEIIDFSKEVANILIMNDKEYVKSVTSNTGKDLYSSRKEYLFETKRILMKLCEMFNDPDYLNFRETFSEIIPVNMDFHKNPETNFRLCFEPLCTKKKYRLIKRSIFAKVRIIRYNDKVKNDSHSEILFNGHKSIIKELMNDNIRILRQVPKQKKKILKQNYIDINLDKC